MTTLIDRYVFTALRRVPEGQRSEIDRELRASIEDAVEARVDGGESRDTAVEQALVELGDPSRLADRYADRPTYLLGPELYAPWRELMKTLFATVLPLVVTIAVIAQWFDEANFGKILGAGITALITTGVHLAFWTTAVFVALERTGAKAPKMRADWTPADLPKYEPRAMTTAQFGANLVWPVLLVAALVLQQFTFTDEPVLDPAGWSFWWPLLIVVIAARGGWALWVHRSTAWTRTAAVVNAVLAVLAAAPVIYLLATDAFFNPAFTFAPQLDLDDPKRYATIALILVVSLSTVYDIAEVFLRAERARRGLPTKVAGTGGSYHYC